MIITVEFEVQPGTAEQVAGLARQTLASARGWDGCLGIQVGSQQEADRVLVVEHWQSDEHAERYRVWRRANVTTDPLAESGLLVGTPVRSEYGDDVDDGTARSSEAENRVVVEQFLASFASGDTDDVVRHLADDATYWVNGTRAGTGVTLPKSAFAGMHRGAGDMYVDGRLEYVPSGWTVEDDRVAVEAKGFATLANGTPYTNMYHFLFVVRGGQILEVREYNDTDHMFSVLMP